MKIFLLLFIGALIIFGVPSLGKYINFQDNVTFSHDSIPEDLNDNGTFTLYFSGSVIYTAIIFRHGDRTPIDPYPTDPWRNESIWPVKFGQLTNIGKRQHYELGKWLRGRYEDFISEDFDPTEVYIRSTDVDRTLMSAQANLAGFYPPTQKAEWNKELFWQPIPIHTKPDNDDEVLAMKRKCVPYLKERYNYMNSQAFRERLEKYQDLMNYLTAYTGKPINNYDDMQSIYSVLNIETIHKFALPKWTLSIYPEKLRAAACYSFATSAATPLMARLTAGPLLKEILHLMQDVIDDKPKQLKMSMYSGHDFTIGNILTALGVFDKKCPEYTATIFIELIFSDETSQYYIRISYRNSPDIVEPEILFIPNCGTVCDIRRFRKLYDYILTVDWEDECLDKVEMFLFQVIIICAIVMGIICALYTMSRKSFHPQLVVLSFKPPSPVRMPVAR